MRRDDILFVGCGGAGNKLLDTLKEVDYSYETFFINTSRTDLESLSTLDITKDSNYICTSTNNGTGRDKGLGRTYATNKVPNIISRIKDYPQKHVTFVASLGGGSGDTTIEVVLPVLKKLKSEGEFDKTVNLIGILPSLNSPKDILENTIDTWNNIIGLDILNTSIFIDNNKIKDENKTEQELEQEINDIFTEQFDSIFDIPENNGRNFDNGNLQKVLTTKGTIYFYTLEEGQDNVIDSLKQASANSILAQMYKTKETVIIDKIDNKEKLKCGYIGTSFNDEKYNHEDILSLYHPTYESFQGYNEYNNMVILSGCLPPVNNIAMIKKELEDREKENSISDINFNDFKISLNTTVKSEAAITKTEENVKTQETIPIKKAKNKKKKLSDYL